LILSFVAYQTRPEYIILAYIAGIAIDLIILCWINYKYVIKRHSTTFSLAADVSLVSKLISKNLSAIFFQLAYMLVIFMDKVIVWVSQGPDSGQVLLLSSPYSVASFLGFIPIFSIVTVAYYSGQMRLLAMDIYKGTLSDIQSRIKRVKSLYTKCLITMILIAIGLIIPVSTFGAISRGDIEVFKIYITTSVAVIFLLGIIYNSTILPLFGKTHISALSILFVCMGELGSIFFVSQDAWFVSLGFLIGSVIGFIISQWNISRLFSEFEYNLFHFLMVNKY
jgi:hypothetical protein